MPAVSSPSLRRAVGVAVALAVLVAAPSALAHPGHSHGAGPGGAVEAAPAGTPSVLVGVLDAGHFDDFDRGTARRFSRLVTAIGTLDLRFGGETPEHLAGSVVEVRGVRAGKELHVRGMRVLKRADGSATYQELALAAEATPVRVAVILFNFSNDRSTPWTGDTARGAVFSNAASAANYWGEVTYGKLALSGDVFGWFPIAADNSGCQYSTWATQAKDALAASGVDLTAYQKFVYVFPRASSCSWAGLGGGANAWLNGTISLRVAAHELGHALGLGHSKSMSCTANGVRVPIVSDLSTCTVSEYGDPFDIMGGASSRHTSNVGKAVRAWLPISGVQAVTASGTYALAPAADPVATAPQLLRVQRADGSWLNLEFRRPFGQYFDNFSSTDPAVNGVTVRWSTSTTSSSPRVLDATPETSSFGDAPLAAGRTLADTAGGIEITTVSVTSTGATVQIRLGSSSAPPPADTQAPGSPGPLSASAATSTTASLSWTAATDNVGVAGYRVYRDGLQIATTAALGFSDPSRAAGATYRYGVAAYDAAGNVGPLVEASVTMPAAPPPPPPADVTPPSAPANLTAALLKGKKAQLAWAAAADDVGVAYYRVLRDGLVVATVTATGYTDGLSGKSPSATYAVVAVDAAGNVSPASNTARVG